MWLSGFHPPRLLSNRTAHSAAGGTLLAVVPFSEEGNPPMGEPIGRELDGRLFTDLSTLTPENPNGSFFYPDARLQAAGRFEPVDH